jgi:hypothetical protein
LACGLLIAARPPEIVARPLKLSPRLAILAPEKDLFGQGQMRSENNTPEVKLKRLAIAFLALAAAFAIHPTARAATFGFSYTAPGGVSGWGTLTGTDVSGYVEITSATGTFDDGVDSGSISLISNPNAPNASLSPSGDFAYDNLLFPGNSDGNVLDVDGLLFSFDGMELNLWEQGAAGMDGWAESNGNTGYGELTVTPEPESLVLMGTGLLPLAVVLLGTITPARRVSHT